VFERFTDRARRVLILAQEQSRLLNHSAIGTEHLLLGLIQEGEGVAAKALASLGVEFQAAQERVLEVSPRETSVGAPMESGEAVDHETLGGWTRIATPGEGEASGVSPRAKNVLEFSLSEAMQLGHGHIGTEHILLGLIREDDGVGVQVLQSFGIEPPRVRRQVLGLLGGLELNVGDGANRFPHRVSEPKCTGCGADLTKAARYRSMTIPPTMPHLPPISVEAVFCHECGVLAGILRAD
jgi:ATP-dependent Clp protease ATP-binding subunit ClpC